MFQRPQLLLRYLLKEERFLTCLVPTNVLPIWFHPVLELLLWPFLQSPPSPPSLSFTAASSCRSEMCHKGQQQSLGLSSFLNAPMLFFTALARVNLASNPEEQPNTSEDQHPASTGGILMWLLLCSFHL